MGRRQSVVCKFIQRRSLHDLRMEADRISRTAEFMAFFRALESTGPAERRVLTDPFAANLLRPNLAGAVRLAQVPGMRKIVERFADLRVPGARTSAIARTWLIDEAWIRAIKEGIEQFVLLGAGFDCRAYRLNESARAAIFEVDHPAMLSLKRSRLGMARVDVPKNVRYAGIDFNRQSVGDVLAANGFDRGKRSMFVWERVTNYLTDEAVDAVLRYVGDCEPGSRIALTYVHTGLLDGSASFFGGKRILRDVAMIDEPWTFGFDPAALVEYLRARSLRLEYDAGAREYRKDCFGGHSAKMKGYDFYHVAIACVQTGTQPQT